MLNVDKQMQAVTRALCTLRVPAAPAEYDLHKMVAAAPNMGLSFQPSRE